MCNCCHRNTRNFSLRGIQVQSIGSPATILPDNQNVIFDNVIANITGDITYNGITGVFTINTPGVYYIDWWVANDGSEGIPIQYGVVVNGVQEIKGMHTIPQMQIKGQALVNVTQVPIIIELKNLSGFAVSYSDVPVQADIAITTVN